MDLNSAKTHSDDSSLSRAADVAHGNVERPNKINGCFHHPLIPVSSRPILDPIAKRRNDMPVSCRGIYNRAMSGKKSVHSDKRIGMAQESTNGEVVAQ